MSDRRRLLLRSSEHISQLIHLALLHEENIQAEYNYRDASRNNRIRNYEVQTQTFEFDVSELLERFIDPSYNRRTIFDVTTINNLLTYNTYNNIENPLNNSCPITHEDFVATDEIIMINRCKHIFKKGALINWLQRRQTCPCCRIMLV